MIEGLEEAETSVLGAVLATGGKILDDIALTGADFRQPLHGEIFDTARSMWAKGLPTDVTSMVDAMPSQAVELWRLLDWAAVPEAVEHHAGIVARHALRRRLSAVGSALVHLDPGMPESEMAAEASRLVDQAVSSRATTVTTVRDALPGVLDLAEHPDELMVPTPWEGLTRALGGFRPGAVYVVAARPGNGKTILAGQIAVTLAGHGWVAFSSLEMTSTELVSRMLSERLLIPSWRVKNGQLRDDDWVKIRDMRAQVEDLRIAIDDRSGIGAQDVRAFARTVGKRGPLSGVVVDYLQLMTSTSTQDRHVQVAEFSRQMKILAKDLGVPVIVLSQLNRASEQRANGVPKLSDLRESGAIEQDADVVMLLHREGQEPSETLVLDVAKNRHGPVGEISLRWDGVFSRVVDDL